MKKVAIIMLLIGAFVNRDSISDFIFGAPDFAGADNQVVLYATTWCGYCQKTRELFADNNVAYIEVDIEASSRGHREFKRLGGRGVPVVNINGTVIHGYDPNRILATLRAN